MLIGPAHQLAVPCMRSLPRVCTLVLFIFSVSILPFPVKYLPPHLWNVWLTVGVTLHAAPSPEGTACPAHPDDEDQIRPPPGPRRPLSIQDSPPPPRSVSDLLEVGAPHSEVSTAVCMCDVCWLDAYEYICMFGFKRFSLLLILQPHLLRKQRQSRHRYPSLSWLCYMCIYTCSCSLPHWLIMLHVYCICRKSSSLWQ